MTWTARQAAARRETRAAEQAARPARKQPQQRMCLRCQRRFASTHAGNRLCLVCKSDLPAGSMAL